MRTLEVIVWGSGVTLLLASCVVTDVEGAAGSGGSGSGGIGTGAAGGNNNTGGSSEPPGGNGGGGTGPGGPGAPSVECGGDSCTDGMVCCILAGAPSCATEQGCLDAQEGLNTSMPQTTGVLMKCDDLADCSGNACCVSGDEYLHIYDCSLAPTCPLYESCSSTGECTDSGNDCVPAPDGFGFRCVEGDTSVACGNATCSGASPVCCALPSPTCVAYGDQCNTAFGCDGGSDCGDQLCCGSIMGSSCMGECQDFSTLCDDVQDCPNKPGPATDCALNATVGYKVCEY